MITNLLKLLEKAFVRLRAAAINPFRRVIRRIQQFFNINLITAKLITPINKKIRSILNIKPKSEKDYVSVAGFWISKKLIHFLILALCAVVFIYFNWFAPRVSDSVETQSLVTTTYYEYDDLKLGEYSGKANIRAANGNVVYTGDIENGLCTGSGVLYNQDGVLIYRGAFDNNKFTGAGILYYPNGKEMYNGQFADNTFSGDGSFYDQNHNLLYQGEFVSGSYQGAGTEYDERGNIKYQGEFQNGNYHGIGTKYYESGIKQYEGEFYMGKYQGEGTIYSETGKKLFAGRFARNDIHYESLLGSTLEDVKAMFDENPRVYFTENEVCFFFARAGVILKGDCFVRMGKSDTGDNNSGEWYMPGDEGEDELEVQEDTTETLQFPDDPKEAKVVGDDNTVSNDDIVELPIMNDSNRYIPYYYLSSQEWQKDADLDAGKILITGVCAYEKDFDLTFLSDTAMTPANGATNLIDCIAIDQIRLKEPTAFSNILFDQMNKTSNYIYVSGINLAEAVYTEVYEKEGVRYKLNYEVDEPETIKFITLEKY